jgi:hypothetical protein
MAQHAFHDAARTTASARTVSTARLNQRLLAEIDSRAPGLSEAERQQRLAYARRAHFAMLALASARARKQKAGR